MNHRSIVQALEKVGAMVVSLAALGKGAPDLLVGYRRKTYLLEVKNPKVFPSERRLNPGQVDWHQAWRGYPVAVVLDELQALSAIGAVLATVEAQP